MAGLISMIWAAVVGGAGISAKLEDEQCKKNVHTLPNGVKYYYDRKSKARLMDGTIILAFGDGDYKTIDGRIIYSRRTENNKKAADAVRNNKFAFATQTSPRCEGYATVELSTGKIIAKVEERKKKDGSYEYRKWYFKDLYPGVDDKTLEVYSRPRSTCYDSDSPGIVISAEEFNAINTCSKLPQQIEPAHYFYATDEKRVSFAYSKPWHCSKLVGEEWKELAQEFIDDGNEDGWYPSGVGMVYVESGYVIKRKRDENEEYAYTRKPGDRWYNVRIPYLQFKRCAGEGFWWFPVKPSGAEYENLDNYK